MSVPSNTYLRYTSIGVREDLANVIYDISPTDTPIMSSIGKAKATQTNHEWQTDALAAATTANALIEGDDAAASSLAPTTRIGNFTQIVGKTPARSLSPCSRPWHRKSLKKAAHRRCWLFPQDSRQLCLALLVLQSSVM